MAATTLLPVQTIKSSKWTGTSGSCLACASGGYACLASSSADWTTTFNDTVPKGYLVVGVEAKVFGASVKSSSPSGSSDVAVKLNNVSLSNGASTTLSFTTRLCAGSSKSCDSTPSTLSKTDANGISGYVYDGGVNTLTLVPDDGNFCISHVELTLTVAERRIQVSPAPLNFNSQKKDTSSTAQKVTVTNNGDAPLTVSDLAITGPFSIVDPTDPSADFIVVANGGTKDIWVKFTPIALGDASGILTITSNAATAATQVQLSGKGVAFATDVSSELLTFEDQRMGTASAPKKVTVQNAGSANLEISSLDIAPPFELVTPPSTPFTLTAGQSQDVWVRFHPTVESTAPETGALTINTDATDKASTTVTLNGGKGVKPNLVLVPATALDFGEVRVDGSLTKTVKVTNTGSGPITFSGISASTDPTFTLVSPPAIPYQLAAGAELVLSVKFSPTADAAATGALTLTSTDADYANVKVNLIGKGVKPHLVVDPSPIAFSDQRVGTESTKVVTVSNTGTGPITLTGIFKTGHLAFTLVSPPSVPLTLVAGDSKTLSVKFLPTTETASSVTGLLTFTSADPDYTSVAIDISGRGVKPNLVLSPSPLVFSDQRVGTESTKVVTVRNSGSGSITLSSIAKTGSSAFTLVSPPGTPLTLAAGQSQDLSVKFSAATETAEAGTLSLTTTDPDFPSASVSISGKGVKPNLVLVPATALDFGEVRVNSSLTKTVKVSNTGSGPITFSGISAATSPTFTLVSPPAIPYQLDAGAELVLSVKFSPTADAAATGALTLTSTDAGYTNVKVDLAGRGVKPNLVVNPSPIAFGDQRVGIESTKVVTVSNTGTGPITFTGIAKTGNSAFTLVSPPSVPLTLVAGDSKTLSVKFLPTTETASSVTGLLTFTSADPDYSSVTVDISGRGVKPNLVVDPNPIAFSDQRVGTESTKVVTVRNSGSGPITISSIDKTGSSAFTLVSPPGTPFTLAAGDSKTLSVKFSAATETAEAGTLTFTTGDTDYSSVGVSISGKGVRPQLMLSATELDFGERRVDTSFTKTVTVSNNGTGPIHISTISIIGSAAFTVFPNTAFDLAAGTSKQLSVTFSPTTQTTESGLLTLTTTDSEWSSAEVDLSGKGVKPNLVLSPTPLTFGEQRVETSTTRTVTVRNNGTGPIRIETVSISGSSAFSVPAIAAFDLAAGASRDLSVTFSPTTETDASATLILTTDYVVASTSSVPLTGKGVKPNLVLSSADLAFGEQRVDTSNTKTVTLSNTGSGPITISAVSIAGSAAFSLVLPPTTPFLLAAGTNKTLSVKFSPTTQTAEAGTLLLDTTDPDWSRVTVNLSGRGVKPTITLSTTELAFGDQRVDTNNTKTVTVTNTGSGSLNITALSITGPFTVSPPDAFSLVAGDSKVLTVKFSPTADAEATGTLGLATNDLAAPNPAVTLTGRGVKPNFSVSPTELAFGEQRVETSNTKTVTLSNTGSGPILITAISLTGSSAFSFTPGAPFTLGAGQSQNLAVKFSPTAESSVSGTLTITTDYGPTLNASVTLSGTGVRPSFSIDPRTISFGEQPVGTLSTNRLVTVANNGSGTLQIKSITISSGPFSVTPSTPFSLGQNASQALSVTFNPTDLGSVTGTLTLTTNDPVEPTVNVSLSGTGVRPTLGLSTTSVGFGVQPVGTTSPSQKVTLTNTGNGTLRITSIVVGRPFTVTPNLPFDLLPGTSQDLSVTFSPTALGSVSATLTFNTNDPTKPNVTINLSGNGVSWIEASPSGSLDFGAVRVGQTVTRDVTFTNISSVPIKLQYLSSVSLPFSVTGLDLPRTLAGGTAVTFSVSFSPTVQGNASGSLVVVSDSYNNPHQLNLVGNGVVPVAELTLPDHPGQSALDFGDVRLTTSKLEKVRLTNKGGAPLELKQAYISSGTGSPFSYIGPSTLTLLPGAFIDFQVGFKPTESVIANDTLVIKSDAVNSTVLLSLAGNGTYSEVKIEPSLIDFGDVRVGATSTAVPVRISNTGTAKLTVQSLSVTGSFIIVSPLASPEIPPSGSAVFTISFKPSVQGIETGSISVLTDANRGGTGSSTSDGGVSIGGQVRVALQGNGTISEVQLSTTALDFGSQRVTVPSDSRSVTIKNPGKAELEITRFKLSSGFSLAPLPGGMPLKIPAGQQETVDVTFTPTTLGPVEGTLDITSNAYTPAPSLALKGKGVDGRLGLTPSSGTIDLGLVDVGGPGTQKTVTLTNTGDATLMITRLTPPSNAAFTISGLNIGTSLTPGESVSFTATFKPVTRGFVSTQAAIGCDSVMNPNLNFTLQGTGVAAAVQLLPEVVNFGKSNVGVSTTQSMSIKNVGERQLYVSNISFADDPAGAKGAALDYSVDASVVFPLLVEAGESTIVQLKFNPRAVGQRQAKAIVYTNDKAAEGSLVGEGTSPNLHLSSPSLDFGNVLVGRPSSPRILKLTNTGDGPLTLSAGSITLGGKDVAVFTLTPPALPLTLLPEASTEVSLTFTPDKEQASFSAQLLVASNDPDAPSVVVPMSGAGVRQQIQLSESSLEFGQQLINHTSSPRTLRITNNSDTNVTLTALTVEGTGNSQFAVAKLPLPLVLAPGTDHQLALETTFTPLSDAEVNCALKITFSELPIPLAVALHGKGIPAVLAINPSPVDFGGVRVGGTRREQPLTITNLSSETIVLAAPEVTYTTGEPFLYDGASLQGRTIEPSKSIILTVGYQPMVETLSEVTLSFGTTTPNKPAAVALQLKGRATKRLLSVDQDSLDFGRVDVNKTQEPKVVTITNKSAQQQRVVVNLKTLDGTPFALGAKALADAIPPGGSTTFTVAFDPDKAGEADNEVQVWLQGETEPEALIPVKGIGRSLTGSGSGCSCSSTEAGSAGMLMLLALVGLGSRRRRRE
ncbi:choice-of-anchor D domain-containing protein [Vitiosangium sp. GDMCC 1.1324]|uniref:choice-of-anchor D domain-containing protein n=1 Tax=Vitiosangium sp. (strain GDMCC 1.1324) TaxID=2138576 RepID=UPI00130E440A|nr:choice-of-anchor D domain-containing protein [Vitiosangium sp. GDMCC 1.1324]